MTFRSNFGDSGGASKAEVFRLTFTGTNYTSTIKTVSGKIVTARWSDGSTNDYSNVADTAANKTYGASGAYEITFETPNGKYIDKNALTKWSSSANGFSGVLSLPSNMTYFSCWGANTLSGVLSLPSNMTYFACVGSNTLSGVLSLPSSITFFSCTGSNTLSGVLSLPSNMTYFYCSGANTLSGVLSLPSSMTSFSCLDSNTLSGVLSLPSNMTSFTCWGSNTLSGVLSLPSNMTSFTCWGSNTLSGVLSLPSSMTSFSCLGSHTLSGYTPGTKAENQSIFQLATTPARMSATDVDNILIDYAAVTTWVGGKYFGLSGVGLIRTHASDAAYTTLAGIGLSTFIAPNIYA